MYERVPLAGASHSSVTVVTESIIMSVPQNLTSAELAHKQTLVPHPVRYNHAEAVQRFIDWLVSTHTEGLTMEQVAEQEPGMAIDQCLAFMPEFKNELNNFGGLFHVDGIEDGRVAWLVEAKDRKKTDPVIVYTHGGGYLHGLNPLYLGFLKEVYHASQNKERLSIIIVEYTLCWQPGGKWPTPLDENTRVLNEISKTCSNISVLGDSAGCHLAIQTLRHQVHPYPGVTVSLPEAKATGAVLISPWINTHPPLSGDYETNKPPIDICSAPSLNEYGRLVTGNDQEIQLSKAFNPAEDDTADWSTILPDKTWVYYGSNEVMAEDVGRWIDEIARIPREKVMKDEGAAHVSIIMDPPKHKVALESLVKFVSQL